MIYNHFYHGNIVEVVKQQNDNSQLKVYLELYRPYLTLLSATSTSLNDKQQARSSTICKETVISEVLKYLNL